MIEGGNYYLITDVGFGYELYRNDMSIRERPMSAVHVIIYPIIRRLSTVPKISIILPELLRL